MVGTNEGRGGTPTTRTTTRFHLRREDDKSRRRRTAHSFVGFVAEKSLSPVGLPMTPTMPYHAAMSDTIK